MSRSALYNSRPPVPHGQAGMNHILPLLTPATVQFGLGFTSKKKLFEHAGELFAATDGLKATDVFASLFERERLGSTALGCGVAIPHGRIKGLAQARGALYRLAAPLEFDAPDEQPVSLCFVLLVPSNANESHLEILSELAQFFSEETLRAELLAAPDPEAALARIGAWKP